MTSIMAGPVDVSGIWDSTNPFNRVALSAEVHALLQYVVDAKADVGLDVVVTCTTDHPKYSLSGNISRHRREGTDGEGLAIDLRMRARGLDVHRRVFDLFVAVERQLQELIYADAPYNVKAGKRVSPYAVSSHHDHVHVAVDWGTMLRYPGGPAHTPEEVSRMFPSHRFVRVPDDAGKFYSWDPATSAVYAWNGAPGPIPSAAGQEKLRSAGGIRDLAWVPGRGLSAVVGDPGQNAQWPVWNFWDLGEGDRQ